MDGLSWTLLGATLAVAVVHTALGPDHVIPFVMLARARGWRLRRTLAVTSLCGLGHVASSLLLGTAGLALGVGVSRLESIDTARGDLAAWALVGFGCAYALWGLRRAVRREAGLEAHRHDGHVHIHRHGAGAHSHPHDLSSSTSFWMLFLIFVLGPCEPLIPLFILPASRGRWDLALLTGAVFAVATIVTMLVLVGTASVGLERLRLVPLERWAHAAAGAAIAASGLAVMLLGL